MAHLLKIADSIIHTERIVPCRTGKFYTIQTEISSMPMAAVCCGKDDETAYFISAGRDNADTIIYRLTEDYLAIDEQVSVLWPGQYREAAAVFKREGRYYMLTSGCTGWEPNQGKYAMADSFTGRWSPLREFGDETTYCSQSAFVLSLGLRGPYVYVGDRWDGQNYPQSTYVYFSIRFMTDGSLKLEYVERFELSMGKT